MPRPFLAMVLGGLLLALLVSVLVRPSLGFTLGVTGDAVAAVVPPGRTVCQRPILVPPHGEFDRVAFTLGTYSRPGPPVRVSVRDDRTRRVLASGRLRGGYPDIADAPTHVVRVPEVDATSPLRVCLSNEGDRRVAVYGGGGSAHVPTAAYLDARMLPADLNLTFEREPRSLLSAAPAIAERASLFRSQWVGPWTYGVLLLVVCIGVPGLLAHALARLRRESSQ